MTSTPAPTRPCPSCGAEWPDEIRFCGECGGRMPDATVVASPYKVQVEATAAPPDEPAPAAVVTVAPGAAPAVAALTAREVGAPEPLLVPHEPATIETRRDIATDAITEAWEVIRHRKGPLALGTFIVALATSALAGTVIGVLALGPLHGGGFGAVALRAASGRPVELNDFFEGFKVWKKLVVSGLLVGVAITLGSVALVLPGIYLAMATAYTPLLIIDRDLSPWQALKDSVSAVNSQLAAHVGVFLGLGVINLAGVMCCGIGLLLTIPLTFVTLGVCYGRVFGFLGGVDRLSR